jgi:hypothetical protein
VPVADVSGAALAGFELLAVGAEAPDDGELLEGAEPVLPDPLLQPATATNAAMAAMVRCCAFTRLLLGCALRRRRCDEVVELVDVADAEQIGLDQPGDWHGDFLGVKSENAAGCEPFPNRNRIQK